MARSSKRPVPTTKDSQIRRHYEQIAVATLDYRRELIRLIDSGATQQSVGDLLGVSQPAIAQALRAARSAPPVRPGFSGASAYEICQRYAVGKITRKLCIDELSHWSFERGSLPPLDPHGQPTAAAHGEAETVLAAMVAGLISHSMYDAVLHAHEND
ncbi:hypothetical protein JT358_09915 [Micrococcales bacterium 31B]|nr:hypothetical protein [Micrococcales bacterium 31B]